MGTTLTMVFIKDDTARFAHVGDSRAYRVAADGSIEQITSDHSFVQALLDAGHITEEQAETHPMGNVLYRALGQTQDLDVDMYRATLECGEKLVLCSDGLTRHVRADEIARTAHDHDDPDEIAQVLVNLANERGGEDNISVIVVIVDSGSSASPVMIDEGALEDDEEDTLILKDPPHVDVGHYRESHDPNTPPSSSTLSQTGHYDSPNAEGQDRPYRK
jgi:serine/threonine protein phosphatase PrpC